MNGGYIQDDKHVAWLASVVPLAQMENHRRGDQFRYAEEHLVVPLLVVVVVQVVEEVPPGEVVRIHDAEKQHEHGISQPTSQYELYDLLHCFIEHNYGIHSQQPDLEGGRRGVEVHMLV